MYRCGSDVGCYGSSPRVRGTHVARCAGTTHQRFIPACAGNTCAAARSGRSPTVHPRVCGEHCRPVSSEVRITGSSPRVRGTRDEGNIAWDDHRFIPACAGNTSFRRLAQGSGAVHPRVCGEHKTVNRMAPGNGGSSPRVRGTLAALETHRHTGRFIPACAGNTAR